VLVERDRLMILVIVGRRTDEHCFRREIGIGSKSQLVSGESDRSLEISSMVTGLKEEKFGGVVGGGM
jgi:hypothetical protein